MKTSSLLLLGVSLSVALAAACTAPAATARRSSPDDTTDDDVRGPDEGPPLDAGYDSRPSPTSGSAFFTVRPSRLHTGTDGQHAFKAPVTVYGAADDLAVTADDPSALGIEPVRATDPAPGADPGKGFLVVAKRAGTFKLVATTKGRRAETTVVVTAYSASDWQAGKERYQSAGPTGNPPCTQCHVQGGAIDHSPTAIASAPDADVLRVITNGVSIAGLPMDVDHPSGHRWSIDDAESRALVTYLRALAPRGFEPR